MDSFNVLRGHEPVRENGGKYYCAGYIKYMPQRGAIYGIEFSNTKTANLPAFKYYIFCSEKAFLQYVTDKFGTQPDEPKDKNNKSIPALKPRYCNKQGAVDNPSTFVVSSGEYNKDSEIAYPRNIGFQGADYQHDPRPYSNLDGFVDSNDVQYPLYIVIEFANNADPGLVAVDYQIIVQS